MHTFRVLRQVYFPTTKMAISNCFRYSTHSTLIKKKKKLPRLEKSLGQHFLQCEKTLKHIVESAELRPDDKVLEIGPGSGILTFRLLEKVQNLDAIEKDIRMIDHLQSKLDDLGLTHSARITHADFQEYPMQDFDICVSNIPYSISMLVVLRLLALKKPFRRAVLLVQNEFAIRLSAQPGDQNYGRLSVHASLLSSIELLHHVPPSSFFPPPSVDSRVIRIDLKPKPEFDLDEWDALIRLCFLRKNKKIRGILTSKSCVNNMIEFAVEKSWDSHEKKSIIDQVVEDLEMQDKRAVNTSVEEFIKLFHAFCNRGIKFKCNARKVSFRSG